MKILITAFAALLLLIFFACNTGNQYSKDKNSQTRNMTLQEVKEHPSEETSESRLQFTPPKIVSDQEVTTVKQDGIKDDGIISPPVTDEGKGLIEEKKFNTEDYDNIVENKFLASLKNPLSTFSIDVDRAAYSNNGSMPPAGAVRIEEMINYFDYDYPQPTNEDPFSVNTEIAECPWSPQHKLVHIGLQGKTIWRACAL